MREARALAARGVRELLLISQDTTFYGIDRGERGALARLLRELNTIEGLAGFGCSTSIRRRSPTTCSTRWRSARRSAATSTCRCSTRPPACSSGCAARQPRRRTTSCLRRIRAAGAGRRVTHDAHRRVPGRDGRGLRRAGRVRRRHAGSTTSGCSPTRTRKARGPLACRTTCRAGGQAAAPERADGATEEDRRRAQKAADRRTRSRILVDGPSSEHELVLQGRLEGRRPTSTRSVFLTDCDPAVYRRAAHPGRDRRRARLRSGRRRRSSPGH